MKAPCNDCKLNCLNLFTPNDRMKLHQSFWNKADDEKTSFTLNLFLGIPLNVADQIQPQKTRFFVFLRKDQFVYRVCRTFFLNTLSIDQKRIYYYFGYINDANTGFPLPRQQGKNVKRVTLPNKLAEVRDQISSFPNIDSHYCRVISQKNILMEVLT